MLFFAFVIFLATICVEAKSNQKIEHISAHFIDGKWIKKAHNVISKVKSTNAFVSDTSNKPSDKRNTRRLQYSGSIAWFNLYPQTNTDPITGMASTSGEKVCFAYNEATTTWTDKTWVAEPLSYKDVKYTSVQADTTNFYFWYYAVPSSITNCSDATVSAASSADTYNSVDLSTKYGATYNNHFIGIDTDAAGASSISSPADANPDETAPFAEFFLYNIAIGYGSCSVSLASVSDPLGSLSLTLGVVYPITECGSDTVSFTCGSTTASAPVGVCPQTATLAASIGRSGDTNYPLEAFVMYGQECTPCTDDDEDDVCFAGTEMLQLENGNMKAIQDAVIGDRVQVVSFDDKLSFAEIVALPHGKNTKEASFIELSTSGSSLKATPAHLVMAGSCDEEMNLIRAEDVSIGDCLATVDGPMKVISSRMTKENGVYTVITSHSDGMIVVNGFKASSFAINHTMVNTFYTIHRVLYNMFPSVIQKLTSFGNILATLGITILSV